MKLKGCERALEWPLACKRLIVPGNKYIVGCCGWTEAQAKYIATFGAIELQTTFYQPPADVVARRWKTIAPVDFRFCMKAWQLITHTPSSPTYRRLKSRVSESERELYGSFRPTEQVALAWERTREIAGIIDARVVVFQCPASFLPTRENIRNLSTFFQSIDRDERVLAWEPRGSDWNDELIRDLCAENDLVHCVDPFDRDSVAGKVLYWRLHGRGGYRYRYTDQDLADIAGRLKGHPDQSPRYVMFNNMSSREDALRFRTDYLGSSETPNGRPARSSPEARY
ncbi:MAG: hypothetical protein JWN34_264 [Bryobacterales bacterium]|nr:hypothetical protein [Bryobacterales bacterium]